MTQPTSDSDQARAVVADLRAHLTPQEQPLLSPIAAALYEQNAAPRSWPDAHPHDVICYTNDAYIALLAIRRTASESAPAAGEQGEAGNAARSSVLQALADWGITTGKGSRPLADHILRALNNAAATDTHTSSEQTAVPGTTLPNLPPTAYGPDSVPMPVVPADELRAAAQKLRETATAAQAASPGTWAITSERVIRCDNGDGVIVADRSCTDVGEDADLPYIALMGPGIGQILANLLGTAADMVTTYPQMGDAHERQVCDDFACDLVGRALTVARAINGSAR